MSDEFSAANRVTGAYILRREVPINIGKKKRARIEMIRALKVVGVALPLVVVGDLAVLGVVDALCFNFLAHTPACEAACDHPDDQRTNA